MQLPLLPRAPRGKPLRMLTALPTQTPQIWQPPPRHLWPDLPLHRAPGLNAGHVRGRAWLHNPYGHQAFAVVSPRAWQLWTHADGRTLGDILAETPELNSPHLERDLQVLWRNGFVQTPGVQVQGNIVKTQRVFNAWLHLTNACNLACPYCYIHKSSNHMEGHVSQKTLDALEETARAGQVDRIHVRFAGGEPMLRFPQLQAYFLEAVERCARHGVQFSAAILTNGTVVPKNAPEWLIQHGISLSISIDGVDDMQNVMRPVKGGGASFERLQAGLAQYLAAGIRPYVLITVGESNLAGIPDLTQWLLEQGLGFRFSLVRDLEWGKGQMDDRHGAELAEAGQVGMLQGENLARVQRTFAEAYARVEAHMLAEHAAGRRPRVSFRQTHKFCDLELWRPITQACGAGKSYVAISEKGELSPCQAALHHPGTQPIRPESLLKQAREQTQFLPFERKTLNADCAKCQFRPSCAGGCPLLLYRREGHVDGRSPYCEVFRAVIPTILRLSALEMVLARSNENAGAHPVHGQPGPHPGALRHPSPVRNGRGD